MPTENRSSNTELISQAASAIEDLLANGTDAVAAGAWASLPAELRKLTAHPSPLPHAEPIAWMVGTAFWWTKEEAERDAAETGLPIVGLGPMTHTAEVERLESRIKTQRESIRSHVQEVDRLRVLEIKYGLKIEERNDLLRKCLEWITSARDGVLYPIARDFEGVVGRNAEGLGQATPALIDAIDDALSASAEPSAPVAKCTNEDLWNCKYCRKTDSCAALADPRNFGEPVEIDERAQFEAFFTEKAKTLPLLRGASVRRYEGGQYVNDWALFGNIVWQARAALERKPQVKS